jgi:predicted ArsR family transcriptional regulator
MTSAEPRALGETDLAALGSLAEPSRRRLFLHVATSPDAVGRDDAAAAMGISRALAAFHLDRLVDAGLLVAEYRRLNGRTGPGAGRPAKLYRRSARDLAVSIPPRDYELAAELFATALSSLSTQQPVEVLAAAARDYGLALAGAARARAGRRAGRDRVVGAAVHVLDDAGFGPRWEAPDRLRLGNCPFASLAVRYRDLTCGMSMAMMGGVVEGLGARRVSVEHHPLPGACCAVFRQAVAP